MTAHDLARNFVESAERHYSEAYRAYGQATKDGLTRGLNTLYHGEGGTVLVTILNPEGFGADLVADSLQELAAVLPGLKFSVSSQGRVVQAVLWCERGESTKPERDG